jgi:broad specificity phosphatase PhoE
MDILLIRHGETELNAARILQPAATPLNERGRGQARAIAARLAALQPAAILASDLPRAMETAARISVACGLPIASSPLLQERNFGDWRGLPYDALGFDPLDERHEPPGGESAAQFAGRVALAFAEVLERWQNCAGRLVVVTHGLLIRTLLHHHVSIPTGMDVPERLDNASLTIIEGQTPHRVVRLNCIEHLALVERGSATGLSGF